MCGFQVKQANPAQLNATSQFSNQCFAENTVHEIDVMCKM